MSTGQTPLEAALGGVNKDFAKRLISSYEGLKSAFAKRDFDACGLRAGKFAEVLLRFLQNELTGTYVPFGSKISNFSRDCAALGQVPKTSGSESFRLLIPRALDFLYTLRNKRDIGHVGGDIDANEIDAATTTRLADWCLSELIRVVHRLSIEDAQSILDAVVERQLPTVWSVAGKKRILDEGMSHRDQTLLLLYADPDSSVAVEDLADWIEVSRVDHYKARVLSKLHASRLIEFDREDGFVTLSPTGVATAESLLQSKA